MTNEKSKMSKNIKNLFIKEEDAEKSSKLAETLEIANDNKTSGAIAHLTSLAGLFIPIGAIFGPIIFYLWKGSVSDFVQSHLKAVINFQLSISLYALVGLIVFSIYSTNNLDFFVQLGINKFLSSLWIYQLIQLVLVSYAAMKASRGSSFQYPLTLKILD